MEMKELRASDAGREEVRELRNGDAVPQFAPLSASSVQRRLTAVNRQTSPPEEADQCL